MTEEQKYILKKLIELPVRAFHGSIEDLTQLQEAFALRIGIDDDWLEKMYGAHVQFILECFACFKTGVPMRLIKLDETKIRIICDECREKLESAKSPGIN